MFLPLFCHFFSHLCIRNFPAYSGSTLRSRTLLEYLKMLTVSNLMTTTVTVISRAECVGKQKRRNCLTSEGQRKCIRNWSLFQTECQDVTDWPNSYWKKRCASAPWHLPVSRKGLAVGALQAMLLCPGFLGSLKPKMYGCPPSRYHRALQSRENWASALSAGQPYRACELLVLTKPSRAAFPSAGEWEAKHQCALGVVFSQRWNEKVFWDSPTALSSTSSTQLLRDVLDTPLWLPSCHLTLYPAVAKVLCQTCLKFFPSSFLGSFLTGIPYRDVLVSVLQKFSKAQHAHLPASLSSLI